MTWILTGVPPEPHTRQLLVVATAHIHWDPEFSDVKLVQTMMLMWELQHFTEEATRKYSLPFPGPYDYNSIPLLFCGDLNSLPDSGTFLSTITHSPRTPCVLSTVTHSRTTPHRIQYFLHHCDPTLTVHFTDSNTFYSSVTHSHNTLHRLILSTALQPTQIPPTALWPLSQYTSPHRLRFFPQYCNLFTKYTSQTQVLSAALWPTVPKHLTDKCFSTAMWPTLIVHLTDSNTFYSTLTYYPSTPHRFEYFYSTMTYYPNTPHRLKCFL